ncbi:MAG: dTDP-4-dehydrorhamnose 3,5-epimerase [Magnetospirillum sp.]|nr:dTDP-4-dehydrorhamnose 3,5-epimerase [Magnetospirillum sp.]
MKITTTELDEVLVIEPEVFGDRRGFFMETYHAGRFAQAGIGLAFVQDNHSRSARGTIRGLHFQNPNAQGKLVRVVQGTIFDVAVDIRPDSPGFRRWVARELSAENGLQLWIPPGFAHGFCVLSDHADIIYKCTELYFPSHEHAIAWNDPRLGIAWPVERPILSARDAAAPPLAAVKALPRRAAP